MVKSNNTGHKNSYQKISYGMVYSVRGLQFLSQTFQILFSLCVSYFSETFFFTKDKHWILIKLFWISLNFGSTFFIYHIKTVWGQVCSCISLCLVSVNKMNFCNVLCRSATLLEQWPTGSKIETTVKKCFF